MLAALRIFLACAFLAVLAAAPPAHAQDRELDIDVFYGELEPHGVWFDHPVWGTVWRPRVDPEWRPYTLGTWLFTEEYGWYWEAEEPWGWAVFHYGRWILDDDDAWIWIPGTEWGPAWVAWRSSEDYVGWAPLPPETYWGSGGDLLFDVSYYSSPRYMAVWCFVPPHQLMLPGLHRYIVARAQSADVFRRTRHMRGYRRAGLRVFNTGFDVRRLERLSGRPVPVMRLRSAGSLDDSSGRRGLGRGQNVYVYKPRIIEKPDGARRIRFPAAADPARAPDAGRTFDNSATRPQEGPGSRSRQFGVPVPDRGPGQPPAAAVPGRPAPGAGPGSPQFGSPGPAGSERWRASRPGPDAQPPPPRGPGSPRYMKDRPEAGPSGPPPRPPARSFGTAPAGPPPAYSGPPPSVRQIAPPAVRNTEPPSQRGGPPPSAVRTMPPPQGGARPPGGEPRRPPLRKDDGKQGPG